MEVTAVTCFILWSVIASAAAQPVKKGGDVDVYSYIVNSTVRGRYASTVITSRVANRLNQSQEILFEVKIPKNSFISKFSMTIEGQTYAGVVKEKEAAQQQYSQAVSRGQSAGLIRSVGRTLEDFKTSVTLAALSKVTFTLTYEELLKRRLGQYQLLLNLRPTQRVKDLQVYVHIHEKSGISFLEVDGDLISGGLSDSVLSRRSEHDAYVTFSPTQDQQTNCSQCGEQGMSGDLLVKYDVERRNPNGEFLVSNGYFVHYFSPSDVPRIPKNVVFIIDHSGSMYGRKMEQTRLALLRILTDLAEDDHFGLITFDSEATPWKRELLRATEENRSSAKTFVKEITDRGATDINAAVLEGVKMLSVHPRERTASILILLTDGEPTSGEINLEVILSNVRKAVKSRFPLYCLGFGSDVNFDFLTKMALENNGASRRIYEDSDADQQLQGFYDEVAVPLLSDVQLRYSGVSNLTTSSFSLYFNGSEIVVSGQMVDNSVETFSSEVTAASRSSSVTYRERVKVEDSPPEEMMERLWAFLTVKQLLEQQLLAEGQEKEDKKKEALRLSLKYRFVTPLTSMVVTKPQEDAVEVADKPKEGGSPTDTLYMGVSGHAFSGTALQRPASQPNHHIPYHGSRTGHHGQPGLPGPPGPPGQPGLHGLPPVPPRQPGHSSPFLFYDHPVRAGDHDPTLEYDAPDLDSSDDQMLFYRPPLAGRPKKKHGTRKTIHGIIQPSVSSPTVRRTSVVLPSAGLKPLCFDLPPLMMLSLLQSSALDFSLNGESTPPGTGFQRLAFHYKSVHHLLINTTTIMYQSGQESRELFSGRHATLQLAEGVRAELRSGELDVTMGNISVRVLLHDGGFLWPVVQKQPDWIPLSGILGKSGVSYVKVQGSGPQRLRIQGVDVPVSRERVVDYRFPFAPELYCWFLSLEVLLQKSLSDLTVPQL